MSNPLQDAAAQQQSPAAPVPLPVNPAGGIMGTAQPAPSPANQTQPQTQPEQAQPSAGDQIKDHLATVGHAVKHFANALEGKQVVYSTDPATGNVTSDVVPRKPGGFFRDILLGAISGAAAASQPTEHPSGAAGLALGFQGAQAQQQQTQQARKQQATDKGQEIQKTNADNLAQATIAHNTISNLNFGHYLNQHTPDEVSRVSASADALKQQALKMGGQLANIPGAENGKPGNGPALMAAYNRDPSIMQGPEGFHRVPLFSYSGTEGLQHDGTNWSDGEGTPDWNNNHGTVTLVDIPNALWNKQVTLTRDQANIIAGYEIAKGGKGSKPSDPIQATYGSLFSLGLKNTKDITDARTALYAPPKNEEDAKQMRARVDDIQNRLASDPSSVTDEEKRFVNAKTGPDGKSGPLGAYESQSNNPFPTFGKIEQAQGYVAKAQLILDNSNSTPAQKQQAEQQASYGKAAVKTFQNKGVSDNDPVPTAQVTSFRTDIRTDYPGLTAGQVDSLTKQLGPNPSQKDYKEAQDKAEKYDAANTSRQLARAKDDDSKIAKGQKPVVGIDANGRQVLVPSGDVNKYGLSQVREVGQAENEKVTNARSLMTVFSNNDTDDPGLLQLAKKLDSEGKLGPVASRLQDWLNKGGSVATFNAGDPNVQRLFTKIGLSTTGLMQVHVGARGSAQMLEHFEDLAKAKGMSGPAFLAALDTENKYVRMKAMLPSADASAKTAPGGAKPKPDANAAPNQQSTFDPTQFPKAQ